MSKKIGQHYAQKRARKAVREGKLRPPTDFDCVDCGAPATGYDHRDYAKPLDVEPVCTGCNNRRGSAKNNDRPEWNGIEGHGYSQLWKIESRAKNRPERRSLSDMMDEHWIDYELDPDVRKMRDEFNRQTAHRTYMATSFLRGLYDWYGIEPF